MLEVTARSAADILDIQSNTAILFYQKSERLLNGILLKKALTCLTVVESYFGGVRKGKRGQGAAEKMVIFSILNRQGKVYTVVVPNTKANTLMPIISSKIKPDSVVYTDSWRLYNTLNVSRFHHECINHSMDFAKGSNHINAIENFWSQAKRILREYNGIHKASFPFFLKECEFRFNYGTPKPKQQFKTLRAWCEI